MYGEMISVGQDYVTQTVSCGSWVPLKLSVADRPALQFALRKRGRPTVIIRFSSTDPYHKRSGVNFKKEPLILRQL